MFGHEGQTTETVPRQRGDADGPDRPTVSVVVPVHEGGEGFRRCLSSLCSASPPADEVIVVVDGGGDSAVALAARMGVRVLRAPRGGPAQARNLGARAARGEVLFFVDADVIIPPTAVREVRETFCAHPGVSALIGSYDDAPAEGNFLSQYKNLFHHYTHQNACAEGFTFWGACGAVRRAAFLAAGGFDEAYRHPSVEDIELGYRLRAAGHHVRVCKHLQVKHLKRWTAVSLFHADFFRRALPWTEVILRAGRIDDDLNISRSGRAKVVLAGALVGTLAASAWWPGVLPLAALVALTLVALDLPLLRFFRRKRGTLFALRVVPWQWFYYFYSGLAFALGLAVHALGAAREAWRATAPPGGPVDDGSRVGRGT